MHGGAAQDAGHATATTPCSSGLIEFVKPARINKPRTGHLEEGRRRGREVSCANSGCGRGDGDLKPGDQVLVDQFKPKDKVDVIGISKGRGFAGVVKRHHFRGGDGTHGSMFHRAPGSIGASSFPSRVFRACAWAATWATSR